MIEDNANLPSQPKPPELGIPVARPVDQFHPTAPLVAAAPAPGPMYLAGATPGTVWSDLGLFIGAIILFDVMLGMVAGLVVSLDQGIDGRLVQLIALPFRGAGWIAIVILLLRQRGQSRESIGWACAQLRVDIPLGLLAAAVALGAHVLCAGIIVVTWPAGAAQLARNSEAITEMLPPGHPIALVSLQVIVGFYEELVFRGFLLTRLRRVLGSWWSAVLVTTLLFAVLHVFDQKAVVAIPLFAVGVTFCLFTIWRKSLAPAIIGHALYNSWQLIWLYLYYPDWT